MNRVFAQAGGGSSSFGGGGGGGFSGGGGGSFGGGGGTGTGEGDPIVIVLVLGIFLAIFLVGVYATWKLKKKREARVRQVELASAEAAADDESFGSEAVKAGAATLFTQIQAAWDARDKALLATMVGEDLMVEWTRRLDDFERKGWHNRVSVLEGPRVQYVGLINRAEDTEDRITVRLEATLRAYVETKDGGRIMREGAKTEEMALAEYWSLAKRDGRWFLLSIEQDAEGVHHLDAPIVASPWGDTERLGQEATAEVAGTEAPVGVTPAELVDLDFSGPVRAQAMDLALADGRWDVDLIEASVRRAVSAWAEAVDGDDAALEAVATPEAVQELLGNADGRTRTVIRGPVVESVTISSLDATALTLGVDLRVRGRRYVEDRDTVALISGSRDTETGFTERWTLGLAGDGQWPWRIVVA